MKKLVLLVMLLLTITSVAAVREVHYNMYEGIVHFDGHFTTTNTPVTNFNAYGFLCADDDCDDYYAEMWNGNPLQSGGVDGDGNPLPANALRIDFPTQLESPFGYAHVFYKPDYSYITWAQRSNWAGNAAPSDPQQSTIYLSKMDICRSPIDSFQVINDAYPNEPVMFAITSSLDATVWSAIQFGGPIGFQAPEIPENYQVETDITLQIRDQDGNLIHQDVQTIYIPFSGAEPVFFEWTPTEVGYYEATVTTTVPDAKCLDDEPVQASQQFPVITQNPTELCYTLVDNVNAQPLYQPAGEPVTVAAHIYSNVYNEFGELSALPFRVDYQVQKEGFFDVFSEEYPAGLIDEPTVTTTQYEFPEEGLYDVRVTARALNCPTDFDETFEEEEIEYLVLEGEIENTPPVLNVPNQFLTEDDGVVDNLENLPDYAFDPDQTPQTLDYAIADQSNPSVATCSIDAFNRLDCEVFTAGQTVLDLTVTDDEGAVGLDLVTITVDQVYYQCNDGIDNDGDGAIDYQNDFSCLNNPINDDEAYPESQCQDGADNDGDGLVDLADPGCDDNQDNNEGDNVYECNDGLDNDNDGAIDFPADFSCTSPYDDDELLPVPQCNDGLDNDSDGFIDLVDPGCESKQDNDEFHVLPECSDGLDNDNDGAIDFPADFSCSSADDNDETFPKAQCQDEIDNDADGLIDFPQDSGCNSEQDNDEFNFIPQCNDGLDNDGDGAIDFPYDFSCASADDNDETFPKAQCQDNLDNDGDGLTDLADPGCETNQDNFEGDNLYECNDTIDNDGDGATDYLEDFSCMGNPFNDDETFPKAQCQDGLDNDNDGDIDLDDVGCTDKQDNDEFNVLPQCSDALDNDFDGAIDFPYDFSCSSADDNDETFPKAQCQDNVDNDGDGLIDLADPGCETNQDNFEGDNLYECNDTIDNDGDGATDYLEDFSCMGNPFNDDETFPKAQCQDDLDNDFDGLIDFPYDPGCESKQDNDEFNVLPQCSDGLDNDFDGAIDFPYDFSCASADDNDETFPQAQCQDGLDNDGDGFEDLDDPGCQNAQDNSEESALLCAESDNGDVPTVFGDYVLEEAGVILYTNQDTCLDEFTLQEFTCENVQFVDGQPVNHFVTYTCTYGCQDGACLAGPPQCSDDIDNDGDGAIDFPADFSCASADDNDETYPQAQCQDNVDNDGDGLTDLADPGCATSQDDFEGDGTSQCQDEIDNDNDGTIDFPQDRGCSSQLDNSEFGEFYVECNDGQDNDGDGLTDWPADPGCFSIADNNEGDDPAPSSNMHITRITVANHDLFKLGVDGTVSMWMSNEGDVDFEDVRVKVFIPELGVQGVSQSFDLDDGDRQRVSVFLPLHGPVDPGYYTVRISARGEDIARIKHREIWLR